MTRHGTRQPETHDVRDLIAARLREAQADAGLTNEELARETGISLRLVQKHRAAHNAPSFASLTRYSLALDRPLSWFLGKEAA